MDRLPNPIDYAVPFFIIAVLLEMHWARRNAPDKYEPRDTLMSLLFGLGNSIVGVLTATLAYKVDMFAYEWRVMTVPATWWGWISAFIVYDFFYYVFHRAAHRIRWFWASHVNHHSSQHYNLSTALRQTWTGFVGLSFIFYMPMMLMGFHPAMLFFVGGLNLIYQFWFHTEAVRKTPRWFEAVMNTPSHHRVHHAVNPRYLDANYAGVFIIWDRMLGTFIAEDSGEPPRYGIVKQLGSFNLAWGIFHEWVEMYRDFVCQPLHTKLAYLFRPPGWSHDGSRTSSDELKELWRATRVDDQER